MRQLVDDGQTVLVVKHHLDVIKCANWVILPGPGLENEIDLKTIACLLQLVQPMVKRFVYECQACCRQGLEQSRSAAGYFERLNGKRHIVASQMLDCLVKILYIDHQMGTVARGFPKGFIADTHRVVTDSYST